MEKFLKGSMILKHVTKWILVLGASTSAWAGKSETRFSDFKAYEVFPLKAENGSEIKIGEGQLSPRPTPIDVNDWLTIGKKLGMIGNQKLCRPMEDLTTDELLAKISLITNLSALARRINRDGVTELSIEEKQVVASTPNCKEFSTYISDLGKALGLTSESFFADPSTDLEPELFSATMISGLSFANEGHGWLTVTSRLSTGQTAVSHLGVKYRDFESLLSQSQYDVAFKYTKQPVALCFKRGKTYRKVSEGYDQRQTCSKTVYVQKCTYDPETKLGKCEQVPYMVEGTEIIRIDQVEESFTNLVQFMAPDFSRTLGVARLTSQRSHEDKHLVQSCNATGPAPEPYPR